MGDADVAAAVFVVVSNFSSTTNARNASSNLPP